MDSQPRSGPGSTRARVNARRRFPSGPLWIGADLLRGIEAGCATPAASPAVTAAPSASARVGPISYAPTCGEIGTHRRSGVGLQPGPSPESLSSAQTAFPIPFRRGHVPHRSARAITRAKPRPSSSSIPAGRGFGRSLFASATSTRNVLSQVEVRLRGRHASAGETNAPSARVGSELASDA